MSLMIDPAQLARRQADEAVDYYQVGQAFGLLNKEAAAPVATPVLHGRLIVSKSGWALLTVPNALARGLFDAMDEKGIELPPGHEGGPFTAHISVLTGDEVAKIGGPDKITERGHPFSYQLGPIMSVEPKGWSDMSRVWFVKVISPELKALRRSYGLEPLPNGDHDFHVSIAVRRKNVLAQGPVSKAAADESDEDDGEDVHGSASEDVHPGDDTRLKLKLKMPLVIQRIAFSETRISTGKPGDDDGIKEFMDRIRSRKASEKQAANYVFHGDVQGVGLRAALHQILDEHGKPGLAYNDALKDRTLVSLPGRSRSHGPIFHALDKHLKREGADYSFSPARERIKTQPHVMTAEDLDAFTRRQGFDRLAAKPREEQEQWLMDRYRLKKTPGGHLTGELPAQAIAQLRGDQPVYAHQFVDNRYAGNTWLGKNPADIKAAAAPAVPVASDGGLSDILSQWHPPADDLYKGMEGFASTFQPQTPSNAVAETLGQAALTMVPGAALAGGLALWRPWERAKRRRRKRPIVKAAGVSDALNAVHAQLPRIRVPDTVVGAGLGALGGAGYDWFQGDKPSWKKRLGRILTGAGAGALAGNVVGDRTRRYIANSIMPFDYAGSPTAALKPKSLSHVWNAAILDKPQQAVADPTGYKSLVDWNAEKPVAPETAAYRKNTLENYILPARVELIRRQLGVHTDSPATDWWKSGPNAQVSLNPENPKAVSAAQRFMGDFERADPKIPDQLFSEPGKALDRASNMDTQAVFGAALMGGQQIPYRKLPTGGVDASVLDRWDYTLDPKEQTWFQENALNALNPSWRNQPFKPATPLSFRDKIFPTNANAWGTLAGRWGLDNLVAYKHPWVTQRFRTEPIPITPGGQPQQLLRMLTPEGTPFGDPITRASHERFVKGGAVLPESMLKIAADYAPGLPEKKDYGPLERLRVGQMLDYIVQQHNAERAGPHHDIRFGDKDMGLLSWAARKGVPEPGVKHLAVQQPVHRHEYKDFEGEIPEGYGKGTVKKHDQGQVLITKVTPESVHFTTAHGRHPERFTLARPKGWDKNWLLMNTTPRDQVPYEKVRYKKIPPDQVEPHLRAMQEGDSAEAKVDGASQLVQLAKGHAEMLSFRTSKTTGRPIFHTERFFGGRPDIPVPKHLEGSILKGEMYAAHNGRPTTHGGAPPAGEPGSEVPPRNGRAAPATAGGGPAAPVRAGTPQDVGTFLNSGIARSLQLQKERGMHLRNMLYDVQQYGKTPVDPSVTPRNERRRMLEEIAGHLPTDKFHVSEEARDPEAAVKLWNMIRGGEHPLTQEGVVFHPKVGIPSKGKLTEEHDVHLTGTFPGEGKRKSTIGGFTYGHSPGKTVGKVGTGFSDAFLDEVARDPSAYTGRVARLRAQQKLPSGALRAPSFIGLHEDTNKIAAARWRMPANLLNVARRVGIRGLRDVEEGVPGALKSEVGQVLRGGTPSWRGHALQSIGRLPGAGAPIADARFLSDVLPQSVARTAKSVPVYRGQPAPLTTPSPALVNFTPHPAQAVPYAIQGAGHTEMPTIGGTGFLTGTEVPATQRFYGSSAPPASVLAQTEPGSVTLRPGMSQAELDPYFNKAYKTFAPAPVAGEAPLHFGGRAGWRDVSGVNPDRLHRWFASYTGEALPRAATPAPVPALPVAKLAGFFGYGQPVSGGALTVTDRDPEVPVPGAPAVPIPKRRRPPPSWWDSIQQSLWGTPDAILPNAIETLEQDGAGLIPKTAEFPSVTYGGSAGITKSPEFMSPTGTALRQLQAPSRPAFPVGRAAPAFAQVKQVLSNNQPAADALSDKLHGNMLRTRLTAASRDQGYPSSPNAAPASTVGLLRQTHPYQLPPTRLVNAPTGQAQHDAGTGQITISDPQTPNWTWFQGKPVPGTRPDAQMDIDAHMPNRVQMLRHETEHGLQPQTDPGPPGFFSSSAARANYQREIQDRTNAREIPPSLGDLPFIAQAHKLETGKPLKAQVSLASGVTHNADWMARQAQQHGFFNGRSTTELLGTQAGKSYLQRLLEAFGPSPAPPEKTWPMLEKQNQDANIKEAAFSLPSSVMSGIVSPLRRSVAHVQRYGAAPFKPFTGINTAAIPQGAFMAERMAAGQAGNALLPKLQNSGFQFYGGRVKAPGSMAAHGTGVTDDLLGLRARPTSMFGGYSQKSIDQLTNQMREAGVEISSAKRLVRPGYHGWNIKGQYQGTPMERQVSPRRLQGLSALDHDALYKSHVLNLPPAMQAGLKRVIPVGMNAMSPMASPAWRYGRALAGVGTVGTVGAVGAGALRAQDAAPVGQPGVNTSNGPAPGSSTPVPSPYAGEPPVPVIKQAAAHPALADLKKAKAESDRKNYGAKHQILRGLMAKHPGEFIQDSTQGNMVGLTHTPTGFKIHAPARILRGRIKAAADKQLVRVKVDAGDGKFLLHHYIRANTWDHPAGKAEPGESLPEAAARELHERAGYHVDPAHLTHTGQEGAFTTFTVPLAKTRRISAPGEAGGYKTRVKVAAPLGPVEKLADLLPWVNLQPQQKRVAKRVGAGENLLVYHGLGSGKSLAGIAAAEGVGGPYTAVVPASLRPNYEGEISKFSTGTTPSEVLSYTGVGMGKQPRVAPNTVIMDEVQRLRNPESAGSRAAMNLAMHAPHRVLLSGTPIVNQPSDLAVPLSILGGEEITPAKFNKRFVGEKTVNPGLMGWFQGVQPTKVPTLQNEDDLERLLEGHVDYQPSRTPEGVHTNDERVEVDLSPEQQDFYKLMWGKLPWMMRWKLSNDYPLSKQEIAHLSSFMTGPRQAALSLYPFHSSKDPMKAYQTSSKLQSAMKSLKETLHKDPRAKALVYSNFIDAGLTPYAAALKAEGIPFGQFHGTMSEDDRKRALADYNEGRSRVLMLGPAAAEGISAKGTQLIQLLDPHWNEARMGQARGRGLRFDSHEGLPPELRDVRIQRFVSKMPAPGWLGRLFGAQVRPSADEVLEQQARRKEDLNEQFREVLRRVGSPGYKRPWSLFG